MKIVADQTIQNPFFLLIIAFIGFSLLMSIAWIVAQKLHFLSLVDAVWALGIGIGALLFFIIGPCDLLHVFFRWILVIIWSFRLCLHLSFRLIRHYPKEDRRYQSLLIGWKNKERSRSFLFFQFQALTQAFFSYPFIVLSLDPRPFSHLSEIAGGIITIVGLIGEWVSDTQLKAFKTQSINSQKICDTGLWKYSRHPNYFFEWLVWCGFGIAAISSPSGAIALACPTFMLLLLLFVTGVPPSEKQSVQTHGKAYLEYQSRTSLFFPLPRKKWK